MISSITLLTALAAALSTQGVNAVPIQSIQQQGNCLQISGTPAVGSEVILSGCNPQNPLSATQTNQQWSITAGNNNAVQLLGTLLCMDAGSDTPDQTIRLAVCNGSPTQTFYLTDDNHIAITGGNQCLRVVDDTAVTTICGGPDQPDQFFDFNLLFDTETATSLVPVPTTLPPGASSTGAVGGASTSSPLSAAASSLASVVDSALPSTGTGVNAPGVVTGSTGAITGSGATATATGGVGGAGGIVSGSTGQMTGTGAMGTATGTGAQASETVTTTGANGVVSTVTRIPTGSVASVLDSLANSASSSLQAAITSLVPLNAAVGEVGLSRVAAMLSAVALGAALVL